MAVLEAHEAHQNLVEELIAEVAAYNPAVDRDLLLRAFRFAAKAHAGQHRRSGQDFVLHPLGAARIGAEPRASAVRTFGNCCTTPGRPVPCVVLPT